MKMQFAIVLSLASMCGTQLAAAPLPADNGIAWTPTAAHLTTTCKEQIARAQQAIDAIDARADSNTKPALLERIEAATADLSDALAAEVLLMNVAVGKDVREASTQCVDALNAFNVRLSAD